MMMISNVVRLLLISVLLTDPFRYCNASQYCASISPMQSAGASGFVAMDIQGGYFKRK